MLYHVTTPKKVRAYQESGRIIAPVRGFDTLMAAMFWAMETGSSVILRIQATDAIKLPCDHNQFGYACCTDHDVTSWESVVDAPHNGKKL